MLVGCKTHIEKKVTSFEAGNTVFPETQYIISDSFNPNGLRCIAVGAILDLTKKSQFQRLNKSQLVRRAVYGVLSTKNYIDVELSRVDHILSDPVGNTLDKLKCDAILTGQINEFKNSSLITYSVTTVELNLKLTDKYGKILVARTTCSKQS